MSIGNEFVITYSSSFILRSALLDAVVHGRASISVQSRRTALAAHVDVDGEENLAGALYRLPHGCEGLAAVVIGRVGRIDATRVELELRAVENLVFVQAASLVGLVQLQGIGAVQVGAADVTSWLATVLSVDRLDLCKVVLHTRSSLDAACERRERDIGRGDAVILAARVVLHLLQEDEIRRVELVDDLVDNVWHVVRVGHQVLGVVDTSSDAAAVTSAVKRDWWELGRGVLLRGKSSERQHAVEAKGIIDDSGDVTEVVTHFGV